MPCHVHGEETGNILILFSWSPDSWEEENGDDLAFIKKQWSLSCICHVAESYDWILSPHLSDNDPLYSLLTEILKSS